MPDLVVETTCGKVRGERRGEVAIWRGIPFAAPPVGPLRFRPPRPPAPWTGERDATQFGAASIQSRDPRITMLSGVSDKFAVSEDCLVLNVHAPATGGPEARHPVLVWIHGGAFIMGSGSSPLYNAQAFARRGVVVVTLNYRLGLLGLMYLGDLAPDRDDGNYLLLDQIAALRWVRDNIAAFGGDPAQVTVMGESAGAISIGTLLAMPAAHGLFQRAILQSGAAQVAPPSRDHATKIARHVLGELGATVEQLPDVPADKLLAAQESLARTYGVGALSPYIDGATVPRHPIEPVRAGAAAQIPILIGHNRDEWTLFELFIGPATVEAFKAPMRGWLGDRLDRIVEAYRDARSERRSPSEEGGVPGGSAGGAGGLPRGIDRSEQRAWVDIVGDLAFRLPALRLAEAQVGCGADVFVYRFDWASPAFDGKLGAGHALELPFVWDRLDLPTAPILLGPVASLQPLATAIHMTWLAFVTTGDPNGGGLPAWPRYDLARRPTMVIDNESRVVDDPGRATRLIWPETP